MRPSRPEMPVMTTLRSRGSVGIVGPPRAESCPSGVLRARSSSCWLPEDMRSLAKSDVDHRLDRGPYLGDLLVEHLVVVVGIARERHRLAEVQAVLHRQRHEWNERWIRH